MSAMRLCLCGEQENASLFCVYSLRLPCKRGFGRSNKCIKGRTGPASLWKEWCSKAAVSRNPERPVAALGYGRCRGGMESSPFMTRRTCALGMSELYRVKVPKCRRWRQAHSQRQGLDREVPTEGSPRQTIDLTNRNGFRHLSTGKTAHQVKAPRPHGADSVETEGT